MKMFLFGALCAWVLLAILAFVSEETGGGITLFDGWAPWLLLLPLVPFMFIAELIKTLKDPLLRKSFCYKLKKLFKKNNNT